MTMTFTEMGLRKPLLEALSHLEIHTPTPVQEKVITSVIEGGDWMVSSQTGSGKTFAFLLPVMHRMMDQSISPMEHLSGPETLVLCPTRELAQQVSQDAITLVRCFKGLRIALVVGGMPYGKQMAGLRGARLVVGTPGRLLDLANSGKLNLSGVKNLIVDEADRMLDLGFSDDLIELNRLCKAREQTQMFSATFAKHVMGLAHSMMNEPTRIEMAPSNETNVNIEQTLHWADNFGHKRKLLDHWLRNPDINQAVIFTSTQIDADKLARDLGDDGFNACALHGAMPQVVRNRRLNSIRNGNIQILVATDVAARGLDVPTISHVFNFGMPMKAEDYVHRIGRTGRAGRSGIAVTLAQADEFSKVKAIEKFINASIPVGIVEGLEPKVVPADRPSAGKGRRSGKGGSRSASSGNGGGKSFRSREEFKGRGFEPKRDRAERPAFGDRDQNHTRGDRQAFGERRSFDERPSFGERKSFGDKPSFGERKSFGDKPSFGERKSFGDKPSFGERKSFGDRPKKSNFGDREGRPSFGDREGRPSFGDRGGKFAKSGEQRRGGDRAEGGYSKPNRGGDGAPSKPSFNRGGQEPSRGGFTRKRDR